MAAIRLSAVTKNYRSGALALGPIDLDIGRGEFVALLGPSGCGKSTALRIIAGLTEASSGSVEVDAAARRSRDEQAIGFVFQEPTLMPWTSVRNNVALPLQLAKAPAAEIDRRVGEALAKVDLADFAKAFPRELSGGMKMRVSLARALVTDPDILLMDEPFAALDAQTREILQGELLRIWEQYRKTIVFITHSLDEAIFLSDRIAVMTRRPGAVKAIIDVPLPRPRQPELRNSEAFVRLRQQAWDILKDEVQFSAAVPRPLGATANPGERVAGEPAASLASATSAASTTSAARAATPAPLAATTEAKAVL